MPQSGNMGRLIGAGVRKEVGSSKLQPQDMAKEFLRTLCTKYLCDELCHKKWGEKSYSEL